MNDTGGYFTNINCAEFCVKIFKNTIWACLFLFLKEHNLKKKLFSNLITCNSWIYVIHVYVSMFRINLFRRICWWLLCNNGLKRRVGTKTVLIRIEIALSFSHSFALVKNSILRTFRNLQNVNYHFFIKMQYNE